MHGEGQARKFQQLRQPARALLPGNDGKTHWQVIRSSSGRGGRGKAGLSHCTLPIYKGETPPPPTTPNPCALLFPACPLPRRAPTNLDFPCFVASRPTPNPLPPSLSPLSRPSGILIFLVWWVATTERRSFPAPSAPLPLSGPPSTLSAPRLTTSQVRPSVLHRINYSSIASRFRKHLKGLIADFSLSRVCRNRHSLLWRLFLFPPHISLQQSKGQACISSASRKRISASLVRTSSSDQSHRPKDVQDRSQEESFLFQDPLAGHEPTVPLDPHIRSASAHFTKRPACSPSRSEWKDMETYSVSRGKLCMFQSFCKPISVWAALQDILYTPKRGLSAAVMT